MLQIRIVVLSAAHAVCRGDLAQVLHVKPSNVLCGVGVKSGALDVVDRCIDSLVQLGILHAKLRILLLQLLIRRPLLLPAPASPSLLSLLP